MNTDSSMAGMAYMPEGGTMIVPLGESAWH